MAILTHKHYQEITILTDQAGAEMGKPQFKLEVIGEVGVEDRSIYLIPS